MDMEMLAEVKGVGTFAHFKDVYTDGNEVILSQYEEEPQEVDFDGRDEFFMALADTLDEMEEIANNFFEVIDSMKINGVR
jgi:hypothetical protein